MGFEGLGRVDVDDRAAATCSSSPASPKSRSVTRSPTRRPKPLPRLEVDEPVLRMTFGVNTSPLCREGRQVPHLSPDPRAPRRRCSATCRSASATRRHLRSSRLPAAANSSLRCSSRSMRREGFELQVSRPEVIIREIDGKPHEPLERAVVDVPDEHVGTVTQAWRHARARSPTCAQETRAARSSPSKLRRAGCSGSARCS